MRVAVIGTGYVGLVSGVGLASIGHDVVCVDFDEQKVAAIQRREAPFHEAGLPELLAQVPPSKLRATSDLKTAVQEADVVMICVGTPFGDGRIDLGQIEKAAHDVGTALAGAQRSTTVVVKSTVVPGTTEDVVRPILEASSGRHVGDDLGLGMNPEFLREGNAVEDFLRPDRIVLGGIDERSLDTMAALYAPFADTDVVRTTPRTAELIKYSSNALLATLISFSNEIANLAASVGVDALEAMNGLHLDRRLSPLLDDQTRVRPGVLSYLEGGCGFGGSCFGKDVRALVALGREHGHPMEMLGATLSVNEAQPSKMLHLLTRHVPDLAGAAVTVLGLAFKPGTDDMRESPAIPVTRALLDAGAVVTVFDPVAHGEARRHFGAEVRYAGSVEDAVRESRAVLLMTRWPEFERLPDILAGMGAQPVVVDGRRLLPPDSVERYEGIGR